MKLNTPKRAILVAILSILGVVLIAVLTTILVEQRNKTASKEFNTFYSCNDMLDRLNYGLGDDSDYPYPIPLSSPGIAFDEGVARENTISGGSEGSSDYSTTNVQVAGVDEADVFKTDGKYVYVLAGKELQILDKTSIQDNRIISKYKFDQNPSEMFINGTKVIVISREYGYRKFAGAGARDIGFAPISNQVVMSVIDVSEVQSPKVEKTVYLSGYYNTARLTDGIVYLVSQYSPSYYRKMTLEQLEELIPKVAVVEGDKDFTEADLEPIAPCEQISYYGETGNSFANVIALNPATGELSRKSIVGGVNQIYMSKDNLYLTNQISEARVLPTNSLSCSTLERFLGSCSEPLIVPEPVDPKTQIFKLGIEQLNLEFKAAGEVEGRILNQFSLDESGGDLRVAVTKDNFRTQSSNSLVIFDQEMNQVGRVDGLAKGERIYSVRFMGERAYVVTFRQVDPLFVFDLSDSTNPKVLGELKIPGFSNYLHPVDQDHIIGFGRDADESSGRQRGLKMALFDVSDPANPIEKGKVIMGNSCSNSELLSDHKALLFDRVKNLLIFPATVHKPDTFRCDQTVFAGMLVYSVDLESGFKEKTKIGLDYEEIQKKYGYINLYKSRSLFIGDTLYVKLLNKVEALNLDDFSKVGEVKISSNYYY